MTKYSKILENGTKKVFRRQSDSLDCFEQVERSKTTSRTQSVTRFLRSSVVCFFCPELNNMSRILVGILIMNGILVAGDFSCFLLFHSCKINKVQILNSKKALANLHFVIHLCSHQRPHRSTLC